MLVQINRIIVKDRFRKRLGDLRSLADNIQERGLIHHIVIDRDFNLVAGARRLAACKLLEWESIEATIISLGEGEGILIERDENSQRKPFAPSEKYEIGTAIGEREEIKASKRMRSGKSDGKNGKRAMDAAAAAVGTSRDTFRKIGLVMEAAAEDPKRFGYLVELMDETDNVAGAVRELKRRKRDQRIRREAGQARRSGDGQCNRLYLGGHFGMVKDGSVDMVATDPPYNISRDRVVHFATEDRGSMSNNFGDWDWTPEEEYLERVQSWSHEFFRVLREGGSAYVFAAEHSVSFFRAALISAGFRFKNTLVWTRPNPKPKPDKTSYVTACDYILFAVKGEGHTFHYTAHNKMLSLITMPACQGKERSMWGHPTQKPVKLIEALIKVSSNPGEILLDPFAGSGTLGEACQKTGRLFIMVEREPKYIRMIEARIGVKHEYARPVPKVH